MITSLRLVNFKNFADETLRVGPFTVIVGANASGKSNIRDAFRFLHGIGRGYTLAEIIGGKRGVGGQLEWEPIRGAMNEVVRFGESEFSIHVELELPVGSRTYSITVGINLHGKAGFQVLEEELTAGPEMVYKTKRSCEPGYLQLVDKDGEEVSQHTGSRPILVSHLFEPAPAPDSPNLRKKFDLAVEVSGIFAQFALMRFQEMSPVRLREPSVPGATVLGDSGQDLPTALQSICSDPTRRDVLTSWLRELTPMDVQDFEFQSDPSGRIHLRILEKNGRSISAYSASDGTLRFLAMLATLLGADPTSIYFFEEIDNGIHPNRLWLLVELMERQTAKNGIQVVTTTHSPDMLNFINDQTFENTSVVSRLEDTDDAIIRPISKLPNAKKLRKSYGLGRLHSTAWMEDILNLEAWKDEDEESGG